MKWFKFLKNCIGEVDGKTIIGSVGGIALVSVGYITGVSTTDSVKTVIESKDAQVWVESPAKTDTLKDTTGKVVDIRSAEKSHPYIRKNIPLEFKGGEVVSVIVAVGDSVAMVEKYTVPTPPDGKITRGVAYANFADDVPYVKAEPAKEEVVE